MTKPLLSATLIGRNEKHNVKRCLDSIWPHVDEVVYVDTGSTDGTLTAVKRYAASRKQPSKLKTGKFVWRDDFAAARNAADAVATGQFLVWADLDDEVIGLDKLRDMCATASSDTRGYFIRYRYAADPSGNPISELWRERVVRNDGTPWDGRLHEHKIFNSGHIIKVDPSIAEWVHHRDHEQRTAERNLRILEAWLKDEPENPRVISSLGLEYMGCDRAKDAADMFARYLNVPGEQPDRRCQAARHLCQMLLIQGDAAQSRAIALRMLGEDWKWADTHLSLAEAEQTLGNPEVALLHARQAMELGKPDTLLIVNPLQYTAHPRAVMAVCLAQLGRFDEAVSMAEEALQIAPTYSLAADHLPLWRGQAQKQHALGAFLNSAQVLVEHGEILKAQGLLSNVPWFITDEPQVVELRTRVQRLLAERLKAAPAPVVDEAADRFIERHQELAA